MKLAPYWFLPDVPCLTDVEFAEIFVNLKVAILSEKDFWLEEWPGQVGLLDSIITMKVKSDSGNYLRKLRTGCYYRGATVPQIKGEVANGSAIRPGGITSFLYNFRNLATGEVIDELLADNVTKEPRQFTKEQLQEVATYVTLMQEVTEL